MAQHHFFELPELLELCLSHLPMRDLLLCQSVSCSFHATISKSPILQQLLFFKALPVDSNEGSKKDTLKQFNVNELLVDLFPPWFGGQYYGNEYGQIRNTFQRLIGTMPASRRAALLRKEASWRRMLPVQPPPKTLEIMHYASSMLNDTLRKTWIDGEDQGVRMGVLYDIAEAYVAGRRTSSARILWHLHPREYTSVSCFPKKSEAYRNQRTLEPLYVIIILVGSFQCKRNRNVEPPTRYISEGSQGYETEERGRFVIDWAEQSSTCKRPLSDVPKTERWWRLRGKLPEVTDLSESTHLVIRESMSKMIQGSRCAE